MQIETLKIFCDILETKSFSKAASLNYISQSAVSQQVRTLEERYHKKLIERGKRTLSATQAGEVLYESAKDILERFVAMENRLQVLSNSITGTLRIASVYSVGLHELPPYLKKFMRRHPGANVRLEYSRANRIYDDVSAGAVDLGIVAFPSRRSGLEILPFRQDTMVVIVAPNHALGRLEQIPLDQLERQPFIAFERDVPTRRAIDKALRAHGSQVDVVMEFDNIETIKRAVEVEAGISIVPLVSVQSEVRSGALRAIPLAHGGFQRTLGILVRKGRERPQIMDKFIRLLQEGDPLGEGS